MSFARLIFYSAMVGGWAAFAGWFVCEVLLMRRSAQVDMWVTVVTAALVGSFIGGGLNFLAGAANGNVVHTLPRLGIGLGAGFVGGALGGLLGSLFLLLIPSLTFGWIVMGLGIGAVEGATDLNLRKLRNGLIGGGVGGLFGGLFFDLTVWLVGIPMTSRAVGLVVLGLCIGLAIGFAQVVLREAWLTVEEGFRAGRQLLLSNQQTYLGTSEKAQMCFIAGGAKGVEPLHVCIERTGDGAYWVRDNGTRTGTFVNEQLVQGAVRLKSGDAVRFGVNKVRFNERARAAGAAPAPAPPPSKPAMPIHQAVLAALPVPQPAPKPSTLAQPAAKVPAAAPPTQAQPAAKVPAAPPTFHRSADQCPVCGTRAAGEPGRRPCQNCGVRF